MIGRADEVTVTNLSQPGRPPAVVAPRRAGTRRGLT